MPVAEFATLSSRLSFGEPQLLGRLAVVPLLDPAAPAAGVLTLEEAMGRGATEVTEVSEAGRVPHLKLLNRGAEAVFLLDGEELAGAKQNRILNLSILVPGASELEFPVACVEQGRWAWRGRGFSGTERVIYSKLRRSNAAAVTRNLDFHGLRDSDQGEVWDSIAVKQMRMEVHSDTGAAAALYERYRADLEEFVGRTCALPGQVGAAFVVDGGFAGLDLLAGPDLLARLLPKLVRSYALDVLDAEVDGSEATQDASAGMRAIRDALARIGRVDPTRHRAIGRGLDLRIASEGLVGGALVADGAIVHLGVWAEEYR
jgi:hypothetical protein